MPGYDQTGPEGVGPTGRRLGPCGTGDELANRSFFGLGRRRRGGGRGFWRSGRYFRSDKEAINFEKDWLKRRLSVLDQRLGELDEDKD
jgi:hypothetical protein